MNFGAKTPFVAQFSISKIFTHDRHDLLSQKIRATNIGITNDDQL
jgi:hypothetical protein